MLLVYGGFLMLKILDSVFRVDFSSFDKYAFSQAGLDMSSGSDYWSELKQADWFEYELRCH